MNAVKRQLIEISNPRLRRPRKGLYLETSAPGTELPRDAGKNRGV